MHQSSHLSNCNNVAKSAVAYLQRKGWEPVASQLVVVSPQHKLKTPIDQVWYAPLLKCYVLVELKVYQGQWYQIPGGMLPKPYQLTPSSPYHHHQLQTALGEYMFQQTYAGVAVKSIILRVHTDGIHEYSLQSWVKQAVNFPCFLDIMASMPVTKPNKTRKRKPKTKTKNTKKKTKNTKTKTKNTQHK
jgi:hypothetical protein